LSFSSAFDGSDAGSLVASDGFSAIADYLFRFVHDYRLASDALLHFQTHAQAIRPRAGRS
jgi:hypothetical protein